jgi:hypothetical protein
MDTLDRTYRLIVLSDPSMTGKTAATAELAKLVPGDIWDTTRDEERLGIEMTEWVENYGKMQVNRKVLVEAEDKPGQWKIGA